MKISERIKDILEWVLCIVIAFALALLIRFFVGTPTIVKMPSMFPTLQPNQRLILNRWVRTIKEMPSRGDIITFEAPSSDSYIFPEDFNPNDVVAKYSNEPNTTWGKFVHYILEVGKESYIKRVIGLPGDHVVIYNGKVYINGDELKEDYLREGISTSTTNSPYYDLVVPENSVFVLGDNRPESTDSRRFGCIPLEKIESKVLLRFWPLNLFGKVK